MTRDELLAKLQSWGTPEDAQHSYHDVEMAHVEADNALLAYIDDPEITKAFDGIDKWYAS